MVKKHYKRIIAFLTAFMLIGQATASYAMSTAGAASFMGGDIAEAESSTLSGVNKLVSHMLQVSWNEAVVSGEARQIQMVAASLEEDAMARSLIEDDGIIDEYRDVAIAKVDHYVYIRSEASTQGDVVGKLYNKSACYVLSEVPDGEDGLWYYISSKDVQGYVKAEFVVKDDLEYVKENSRRIATVTCDMLMIRQGPSTDTKIIDFAGTGEDLTVVDESMKDMGWVMVSTDGGEGYVCADYVELGVEFVYAESKAAETARLAAEEKARKAAQAAAKAAAAKAAANKTTTTSSSGKKYDAPSGSDGKSVADYACQFVGNPYVWGGTSLTNGADCSGFVMSVYKAFGVSLPHSSKSLRSSGYGVEIGSEQPGDIICYSGHVAIYIGDGKIVHASTSKTGIIISNMSYKSVLAVRRIF